MSKKIFWGALWLTVVIWGTIAVFLLIGNPVPEWLFASGLIVWLIQTIIYSTYVVNIQGWNNVK